MEARRFKVLSGVTRALELRDAVRFSDGGLLKGGWGEDLFVISDGGASTLSMKEKQQGRRSQKQAAKQLATAPNWTDREWFEIWLRMARRSYPAALR